MKSQSELSYNFKSEFLREFHERGYLFQATHINELDELMANSKITAYIGFDCTAQSLHIGSLIQIMILRLLQKHGHKPIVLLGGGTTKVGDPSGKDEARKLLNEEQIEENLVGIAKTLRKFDLSLQDPSLPAFEFVDNDSWLKNLNYIEFLRDFGKHFSVNRMLSFDSVKLRLERQQSLSFIEFNYMVLQSYDFYHLRKDHNCILQIGGSDQWGNIVNGVDLIQRIDDIKGDSSKLNSTDFKEKNHSYGLTTPLLTTSDGKKMGKTANGAVWLSSNLLSEFEYFQYFRNVTDADVGRFLKLFTELNLAEIAQIESKEINEQKKILAFETTKICHGENAAKEAKTKAESIFEKKSEDDLPEILLTEEKSLFAILVEAGISSSNGEAKRLIKGGGVKINDEKINDEHFKVSPTQNYKLSAGKKHFFKLTSNLNK